MQLRAVGIYVKPEEPQLAGLVKELVAWLRARGIEAMLDPIAAAFAGGAPVPAETLADAVDLVIVLGGDGTLLAAARAVGTRPVPVLGVNLGTLGFLAETSRDEVFDALEDVRAGRFTVSTRMRLDVEVERAGASLGRYLALNDAVIGKSTLSRMIDLETRCDEMEVTTYHADGLIVATPTGSSAYSLSAGGPLLLPEVDAIVLTPICPHTLTQRPLVLPETVQVEIRVQNSRGGDVHLTVDGQVGHQLQEGDRVLVRASDAPARLLVSPRRNRFQVMRTKLRWGER